MTQLRMRYSAKLNTMAISWNMMMNALGGFEPLKHFANNPHKGRIVLGLISSKFPELEIKWLLKPRIKEATQYVPLEQLCLSSTMWFCFNRREGVS